MRQGLIRIPPPIYALAAAACMWLLYRHLPLASTDAQWPRIAGFCLIATGVAADLIAVWQFRQHRTTVNPLQPGRTTAIVTSGLYRLSRNPMYTGLLIALTGIVFVFRSLSPIIVLPAFMWVVTQFQIKAEERILLDKFGEEYNQYLHSVPRWF